MAISQQEKERGVSSCTVRLSGYRSDVITLLALSCCSDLLYFEIEWSSIDDTSVFSKNNDRGMYLWLGFSIGANIPIVQQM